MGGSPKASQQHLAGENQPAENDPKSQPLLPGLFDEEFVVRPIDAFEILRPIKLRFRILATRSEEFSTRRER